MTTITATISAKENVIKRYEKMLIDLCNGKEVSQDKMEKLLGEAMDYVRNS